MSSECKRGGEIIDGSFWGKEFVVLDPPRKRVRFKWLKKIVKEIWIWT